MVATNPERVVVRITDTTTRAELAETLRLLNDNAKRIGRRGYCGTRSEGLQAGARTDRRRAR